MAADSRDRGVPAMAVGHLFTNEPRMAIARFVAVSVAHSSAFWLFATSQSTNPLSRICPVALSIRRWRQVLSEKGERSEPLGTSSSLREMAGD